MDPVGTAATGQPLLNHNPLQQSAITYLEFTALNSWDTYQDGGHTSTDSVLAKRTHAYAAFIEAGMVATNSASNHSTYNRRNQLPESTCKVLEQLHITQSTRPVTVPPQSTISWSQDSQLHIVT